MMNSINWLEAYFGIVRIGAVAAPLDFRFTEKDFKYCVDVAEPKAVILDEQFADKAEAIRHPFLSPDRYIVNGEKMPEGMERVENVMAKSDSSPMSIKIGDEEPCGLYFASGTPGDPKPILLTHKNMEAAAITEVVHKKEIFISGLENVYPVEIEEILQGHPKVHDVGVIGLPDQRLGEIVTAVIDVEPNVPKSLDIEKEILQFCEENLASYKRPRRIIFGKVPRNPTGKIEKTKMKNIYAG